MTIRTFAKRAVKNALYLVVILFCVGFGQLTQWVTSLDELRTYTLTQYQSEHQEQAELVQNFIKQCLTSPSKEERSLDTPSHPISIYDCGQEIGADELVSEIKRSDGILETTAWPLSLLN